jgi:hypothetical protein
MKVEVNKSTNNKPKKYPYLAGFTDSTVIVMWYKSNTCIVLQGSEVDDSIHTGTIYTSWYESDFQPFNGTITLSND